VPDGGAGGRGRPAIAIDPSDYARRNALALGATHAIDPSKEDPKKQVYDILPQGPDVVIEAAGPIAAVRLMTDLRRRGTRWNIFGITTHEQFELDGGYTHFLEGRMDASFGTTPLAMQRAIRLMELGLVNPEKIISHRFALRDLHKAVEVMGQPERNKVETMGWSAQTYQYGLAAAHSYWYNAVPAIIFLAMVMMPFYYICRTHSVPGYLKLRFDRRSSTVAGGSFTFMTVMVSGASMFAMVKILHLLLGLGVTAMIAGFMSGMAGNVSAFATVWVYDVYKPPFNKNASDHHYLNMGRLCALVGVGVSIGTAYALFYFSNVLEFFQALGMFFLIPLFAVVIWYFALCLFFE
jgi:hypothetical protein